MSGGSSNGNSTTTQEIPAWLRDEYQQNIDRAQSVASSPYQAYDYRSLTAPDNAWLQASRDLAGQSAGIGQGLQDEAARRFSEAGNQSPFFIQGQQAGPAAQRSAAQIGDVLDVVPDSIAGTNRAAYTNPYVDEVVNRSLADLDRSRQMQINDNAYAASQAGAFGGSRHGVVDSLTNEATQRQAGLLGAQLRSQGFDTASGLIQSDLAQRNAAMTGNADRDLAARGADAASRQQAMLAQTGAQDALSQFNAQQRQGADLANQQQEIAVSGVNLQGAQGLLGTAGQQQQQALNASQALGYGGAQLQGQQQLNNDKAYEEYLRGENLPYQNQQLVSQAVLGIGNAGGTTTSNSKAKQVGL